MSPFLSIAVDTPLRRTFDYLPPEGAATPGLAPGVRVWVPFGRRKVVGVVVAVKAHSEVPAGKLRRVLDPIDASPILDADLLELLLWAAEYYKHPVGEVIAAALPLLLRTGTDSEERVDVWSLTEAGRTAGASIPRRSKRLHAVLELLADGRETDAAQFATTSPSWRTAVRELITRGFVEKRSVEVGALPRAAASSTLNRGPELSAAQQVAVTRITDGLGAFGVWLLDGVTGSGKTEVYLRLIETVLAQGKQALVLVPEIALTPQLLRRFQERFQAHSPGGMAPGGIVVLHSSLTDSERLRNWRAARSGAAGIVLGTRSAVFAALARPGIVIVDEEHDPSFKQQESFRYSARDLAIVRAQRQGIPVVLGSATPSLEVLSLVERGRAQRLELPQRAGSAQAPRWSLVDLRQHASNQGLATPTMLAIEKHLAAGSQVLLYLNRRGYAPVLFCTGCGWAADCPRCDARLTVHRRENRLVCHHCGQIESLPPHCPKCQAEIKPVGQGTERLEETLGQLFAGVPIARIDADAMRRKDDLMNALASVDAGEVRLLVGTQMLSKGHHFPGVTLVVIVNADQGLFGTDFRSSERLAQAIVQVAGRAGRAERPGEVIIQTAYPEHPLLQILLKSGYPAFAASALAERARAGWPPYSRLALLRAESTSQGPPHRFLAAARRLAEAAGLLGSNLGKRATKVAGAEADRALAGGQVGAEAGAGKGAAGTATSGDGLDTVLFGPAPAPMRRRAGHYREQLLVQAATPGALHGLLNRWLPQLDALPEAKQVRWSVDVDPAELF